jgi:NADPH2:quinone reductase
MALFMLERIGAVRTPAVFHAQVCELNMGLLLPEFVLACLVGTRVSRQMFRFSNELEAQKEGIRQSIHFKWITLRKRRLVAARAIVTCVTDSQYCAQEYWRVISRLRRLSFSGNAFVAGWVEKFVRHTRIIVTHYGGPDTLQVVEEECPEPKRGEVRVRVLAAGVALPDILAREGVHPETPKVPFTPGWDLVGVVDRLGDGVTGTGPSAIQSGQIIAAMPISGAYAQFVCLPQRELVPVPSGLDAAEAVCLVLNYITAYQMLHRSAKVRAGQRVLIHGAAGGVGSALLQLGRLAGLEMYGTCSSRGAQTVRDLGGSPIDYENQDFVKEIQRLTGEGVDAVFDGIGGSNLWRSREALRSGGKVVVYGFTAKLRGGRMASGHPGGRHRFREAAILGLYVLRNWFLPGRKRMAPYSIQTLKRLKPAWFREDLMALLDLLHQQKIKPLIARRFPLAEAKQAHELLGEGGVTGKIVLVP